MMLFLLATIFVETIKEIRSYFREMANDSGSSTRVSWHNHKYLLYDKESKEDEIVGFFPFR